MYMYFFKDIYDNPGLHVDDISKKYPLVIKNVLKKYHDAFHYNEQEKTLVLNEKGQEIAKIIDKYPGMHPYYCEIYVDTMIDPEVKREIVFIQNFYLNWSGSFLHLLGDDLMDAGLLNSCTLYCYMSSISDKLNWLAYSLLYGQYDTVNQELKTILENLYYYYTLDVNYPHLPVKDKLTKVRKLINTDSSGNQISSKPLLTVSDMDSWKNYDSIYKTLCQMVSEATIEKNMLVAAQGFPDLLEASYDRDSLKNCVKVWHSIAHLAALFSYDLFLKNNKETTQFSPFIFQLTFRY
ncbi:hypothetical protein [Heliophilum fasciatum]|uniref:Uncharacterized protein n=1 Tax=Heliophilum fasciatum TaxID=35700 RepID=A0A4R2RPI8_9FIRM|nr:hypothetical protein [Heliophilum fasciatum]MCW2279013.1 hypothetical protein [Heliophilum fasciatum]TCP61751.1 hypothetical protein EDD73_12622 [Heliophilum fasciatum]